MRIALFVVVALTAWHCATETVNLSEEPESWRARFAGGVELIRHSNNQQATIDTALLDTCAMHSVEMFDRLDSLQVNPNNRNRMLVDRSFDATRQYLTLVQSDLVNKINKLRSCISCDAETGFRLCNGILDAVDNTISKLSP